jgi:hypothetical protein
MYKLTTASVLALSLFGAMNASVAQERDQHWVIERTEQAREVLGHAQEAEAAKRRFLMKNHMSMLDEVLQEMSVMKPQPGLNMQQTAQWIAEHQQITRNILGQMMEEHHLMMQQMDDR